jgi:hypothetical protein
MGLTTKRFSVVAVNRYPYIRSCMFSISMNEMMRWIRNYDRLRLNPNASNESWTSTRYEIEGMRWSDIERIYLPEIGMCWGPACSAIKKSWWAFKMAGKNGGYRTDIAFRINRIQAAMGIPRTPFAELDPQWVDEQLAKEEEIQLRRDATMYGYKYWHAHNCRY